VTRIPAATTSSRSPTLRKRLDNLALRWQARLDSESADRFVPWGSALVLFVLLGALALGRARSLDGGADLASYLQGAWLINQGDPPLVTITGTHLLADQAGFVFYPLAWIARWVPAVPLLLLVQAAALEERMGDAVPLVDDLEAVTRRTETAMHDYLATPPTA